MSEVEVKIHLFESYHPGTPTHMGGHSLCWPTKVVGKDDKSFDSDEYDYEKW